MELGVELETVSRGGAHAAALLVPAAPATPTSTGPLPSPAPHVAEAPGHLLLDDH